MANPLLLENIWLHQQKFEDAERLYRQIESGVSSTCSETQGSSVADGLSQIRQDIQNVLNKPPVKAGSGAAGGDDSVYKRLDALEKENKQLKKITDELRSMILNIQSGGNAAAAVAKPAAAPAKPAAKDDDDGDDDDDDDIDLFGDDDEEEVAAAAALREKRLKEYAERKAKKPQVIAKSSVVLDVKPWDDETDMAEVEKTVRKIEMDGLLWGAAKLVEVGYGIKKLVISCVVEDEKVSIEDLSELICEDEDHVQSVDIAAFNKI